jgi:hypothetical protein
MTEISADRQACVLNILREESPASTKRIMELASSSEFQEICRDCRSGVEVYEVATKLQREGLITRTPGRGGFVWALVEQGGQTITGSLKSANKHAYAHENHFQHTL